jgi:hypothetical protein
MALLGTRTADASDPWRLARAIDDVSRRISADAVAAFDHAVVRSFQGAPADSASRSVERLRLRAAMHKEFTS